MGRKRREKWERRVELATQRALVTNSLEMRQTHRARVWGYVSAAVMCIGAWLIPRSSGAIVFGAIIVFICAIPAARNGYVYKARWYQYVPILVAHAVLLALVGWAIWPRITITPQQVGISGNESFRFRIKNETSSTAYRVAPVVFIRPAEMRLHLLMHLDSQPSTQIHPIPMDTVGANCETKNEEGIIFPMIPALAPGEERWMTITGDGNVSATLKAVGPAIHTDTSPSEESDSTGQGMEHRDEWQAPASLKAGSCRFISQDHERWMPK